MMIKKHRSLLPSLNLLLLFLMIVLNEVVYAQKHTISLKTEIPVQYAIQYEYRYNKLLSFNCQLGVITFPFDDALIGLMDFYGGNKDLLAIVKQSFNAGGIIQYGPKFYFQRKLNQEEQDERLNYVGLYLMHAFLKTSESPRNILRDIYNINFPGNNLFISQQILLKSSIHQFGTVYGRIFPLKNERLSIHLEGSLSVNIYSQHHLYFEKENLPILEDYVDKELKSLFHKYAFIPSINLSFNFSSGKKE